MLLAGKLLAKCFKKLKKLCSKEKLTGFFFFFFNVDCVILTYGIAGGTEARPLFAGCKICDFKEILFADFSFEIGNCRSSCI